MRSDGGIHVARDHHGYAFVLRALSCVVVLIEGFVEYRGKV